MGIALRFEDFARISAALFGLDARSRRNKAASRRFGWALDSIDFNINLTDEDLDNQQGMSLRYQNFHLRTSKAFQCCATAKAGCRASRIVLAIVPDSVVSFSSFCQFRRLIEEWPLPKKNKKTFSLTDLESGTEASLLLLPKSFAIFTGMRFLSCLAVFESDPSAASDI